NGDFQDTIELNGIAIDLEVSSTDSEDVNLQKVVAKINEVSGRTGVTAFYDGNPANGVQLTAEDGRNIHLVGTAATDTSVFGLPASDNDTGRTYAGSYTLISKDGSDIKLDTSTGNIANAGFQ